MDLSGSMQGAGGVGGLLSVNDGSATYYPIYDGNGNVSEYVDATGAVVAHYEYDAFGQAVASGTKKDDFSHQFSTKQLNSESGLHYYGYRYYDSSNGRWPGRDPLGEKGGVNRYAFIYNDGLNSIDLLGLDQIDEHGYRRSKEAYEQTLATMNKGIPKNMKSWVRHSLRAGLAPPSNSFTREYTGIICCSDASGEIKSSEPHAGILTGPHLTKKGWVPAGYDENFKVIKDRIGKGGGSNPFYDVVNKKKVSCKKLFGDGFKLVGTYHSHPPGDTKLSGTDKSNSRRRGVRIYVGSNEKVEPGTDDFVVEVFEPNPDEPITEENSYPGTTRPVPQPES